MSNAKRILSLNRMTKEDLEKELQDKSTYQIHDMLAGFSLELEAVQHAHSLLKEYYENRLTYG